MKVHSTNLAFHMWDELTIEWNDLTILWNDLTIDWNDLTMERNDRIPSDLCCLLAICNFIHYTLRTQLFTVFR